MLSPSSSLDSPFVPDLAGHICVFWSGGTHLIVARGAHVGITTCFGVLGCSRFFGITTWRATSMAPCHAHCQWIWHSPPPVLRF
jgi:hypothetical protein